MFDIKFSPGDIVAVHGNITSLDYPPDVLSNNERDILIRAGTVVEVVKITHSHGIEWAKVAWPDIGEKLRWAKGPHDFHFLDGDFRWVPIHALLKIDSVSRVGASRVVQR